MSINSTKTIGYTFKIKPLKMILNKVIPHREGSSVSKVGSTPYSSV